MQLARPVFALHPLAFGRGPARDVSEPPVCSRAAFAGDVKLFATTFVAGFIFMSILIG